LGGFVELMGIREESEGYPTLFHWKLLVWKVLEKIYWEKKS